MESMRASKGEFLEFSECATLGDAYLAAGAGYSEIGGEAIVSALFI
jgi:hypothetical protein